MSRPYRKKQDDRLLCPGATSVQIQCDFACAPLDRAARAMDEKWGVDRLPEFAPADMAAKYGRAIAMLHDAMDAGDVALTAQLVGNCAKGLAAMDAAATSAGHAPLPPEIWEAVVDGNRFGIIRGTFDCQRAEALRPGLPIYTMREVANALAVYRMGVVEASRQTLPAPTKPTTALESSLNDFIPF